MAVVVITEFMDEAAVEQLRAHYDTVYDPDLWEDRSRLEAMAAEARALVVRNKTTVDAGLVALAPALEVVGRLGVGLDNIDVAACAGAGVEVQPATGANANAVAEYVVGAALMLVRGAFGATADVAAGSWPRTDLVGREIAGRVLGLVGFGGIARRVATKLAALGMEVAAFDPLLLADDDAWSSARRHDSLDGLLAESDVVSIHVPLTKETEGMFDAPTIAAMKPGAVLINSSRGGIVEEAALAAALVAGDLGGAALDVFATEPLDAAAGSTFEGVPNLILSPHIAGITAESNAMVSRVVAEGVLEVLG